ncbi:hypothetical protein HW511_14350 [Asaia siamensis]|uniref:Glycosyltransferase n=1 Tax=Asaia siamensis TaxID=110479 RepID=A0ABQ1MN59_9PROT|nr:hypothetical protein [Asaia siamensis]GBR04008.1 glycosyltransferase [Asaia siamensis NRIC 0323]GGC41610.1 hypothetical protein GCM10007207_28650 [Asaia siamensis]
MTVISETLSALGPGEERETRTPLWAVFDPVWYRARYGQAVLDMMGALPDDRGLFEFWQRDGARYAQSPNRYFDEIWYRRVNHDVETGIRMGVFESGFQHYCETGHRGRSCHWLFSESDYFHLNPDLTPALVREMGYSNGYDHYLEEGQLERRVSMPFFVPDMLRAELFQQRLPFDPQMGEFTRLILSQDLNTSRCSWYFDPVWYLAQYEDVAAKIESGEYVSPLHHYLSNETPTHFSPNAAFNEGEYLERYPDVNDQVRARSLRNGYDHFVRYGLFEGRSPADGISLPCTVLNGYVPTWRSICDNAFIDLVKNGMAPVEVPSESEPALRQLAHLQALRADTLIPLLSRSPLDFRYVGTPDLSVLISPAASFLAVLQTLASLHEGNRGTMQVVLLDRGARDETAEIGRYAYGVERVTFASHSLQDGWQRAVPQLAAARVLLIEAGCHLFYGSLDAALARLDQDGAIAVAPQGLGLDLRVAEAGLSVARDGSCSAYGAGKDAFAPEVDFVRPCDTVGGGALLCYTDALRNLPSHRPELQTLRQRESIWAALGLSLRQAAPAGRLYYDPSFVVRLPDREGVLSSVTAREALVLRRYFAEILRGNLPQAPQNAEILHRSSRWGDRILLLTRDGAPEKMSQRLRLRALSESFVDLGLQVTLFVLTKEGEARSYLRQEMPESVEFRTGSVDALGSLIEQRVRGFDRIWICGGHTLNTVFPLLSDKAGLLPEERVTLDLREVEAFERENDLHIPGRKLVVDDPALQEQLLAEELAHAWFCQDIVVQNDGQAALLREAGLVGLTILGDEVTVQPEGSPIGRDFGDRHDLLFAAQPATAPGYTQSFLKWFVREVLLRLEGRLSEPVRLIVANGSLQSFDLSMMTHYRQIAPLVAGQLPFAELASTCRVLIAPDEGSGQIALQRIEAASCGLPCVAEGGNLQEPLNVERDAGRFADAIVSLYQSEETWRQASEAAMSQAARMRAVYRRTLARLVGQSVVKESAGD